MRIIWSLAGACGLALTSCFTSIAQPSLRQAIELNAPSSSNPAVMRLESSPGTPQKSVLLGIAYSLILPGLGDVYAKKSETGKYYIGADLGLWLVYGGFQAYGHWVKSDARSFAVQKAGADFSGKSQQFEVDLGNFNNTDEYNQAKLRNREFDLIYDPASSYGWNWRSEAARLSFKDQRIRGDEIIRNSQFVIAALVVNRVIAAISAARSVSEYNRNARMTSAWRLGVDASGNALDGVRLTLTKSF